MENLEDLVKEVSKIEDSSDVSVAFKKLKREYAKIHQIPDLPTNTQLLTVYRDLVKR
jgi:hypothetical protein